MYTCTIDFQMLYQINLIFKENKLAVSLHTIGGCSCNGVELRNLTDNSERQKAKDLANAFLKTKYLVLKDDPTNPNYFLVASLFEK